MLLLGAVLGAVVGLAYSWLRPPLYEATAAMNVQIQYGNTANLALVVEDRVLSTVAQLIVSDSTLDTVLDRLPDELRDSRGWDSAASLRTSLRLDRLLSRWELIVMDSDPAVAAAVAGEWSEAAIGALEDAQAHAWRAAALLDGRFDVSCSHVEQPDSAGVTNWVCSASGLGLPSEALTGELQSEIALSRGVLPSLTYTKLEDPTPPPEPVLWARGTLVGVGAAIGLLLALGVVLMGDALIRDRLR